VDADHTDPLPGLLARHAARAAALAPDAAAYWARHAGRFEFVLRDLDRRFHGRALAALDVGPSFQTRLLAEFFPAWRIDTLGERRDGRFALPPPSRHFEFDLNTAAERACWPPLGGPYDVIVFMEVIEHLTTPPRRVLEFLGAQLAPGGAIVLTTPNAAWLKNRLRLLLGRNPFEPLRDDRGGHIRESTLDELAAAAREAGLEVAAAARRGLYRFSGVKDRFYSALADATHPSLRRSIFLVLRRPA
jgi:SAM-dependent methyltransferase